MSEERSLREHRIIARCARILIVSVRVPEDRKGKVTRAALPSSDRDHLVVGELTCGVDSTKAVTATEDMWATAFARLSPSERLIKAWLQGLGYNRGAPAEVLISLLDTDTAGFLYRDDLPEGVLDAAATHPSRQVWGIAVETGRLSAEQWDRLLAAIADPKHRQVFAEEAAHQLAHRMFGARTGVSGAPHADARPPSTHTEIATMAAATPDIDPQTMTYTLWWVAALHDNSDAMRQLAYSSNLWIRRSVARATHLPPDVVNLLARDEDRIVHLFLSESCDDASPHMLLDVWTWWSGSLSFPGRPRQPPQLSTRRADPLR